MIDMYNQLTFSPTVVFFRLRTLYITSHLFSCFRDISYAILLTLATIYLLV